MEPLRRADSLDRLHQVLEARPTKLLLVVLIVLSVLPYRDLEESLRPVFLTVFGLEMGARGLLLARRRVRYRRLELLFLAIDIAAFVSFLPLEQWLATSERLLLRSLRVARLLMLLRFARELAGDVYRVLTRREQLQQFGLVTTAVAILAFVSAVILTHLMVPHDYDTIPDTKEGFWDRMWWAFRQIESPDNLVANLRVHPAVAVLSLGLTITGVFIVSYIIGIGANVVDQVVRAERRRSVPYRRHAVLVGAVHDREVLVREFVGIYDKNRGLRRVHPRDVWRWAVHGEPFPRRHALPRMALLGPSPRPPSYLHGRGMRWVVYREGDPSSEEALERVAVSAAKRILLLGQPGAGDDADAIAVAELAAVRQQNPHAHVLVEVLDSDNEILVEEVGGEGTFALDVPRFLGLLLCHHLTAPGLDGVFRELLTAEGSEFYTHIYVDAADQRALARRGERHLEFDEVARWARERHDVLLTGVFLSAEPVGRLPGDLVPVDRLTPWVNPRVLAGDELGLAALGAEPGRIPVASLRGLMGIAETYRPLESCARALAHGRRDPATGPSDDSAPAPDAGARALVEAIRVPSRRLRRVLIVGYSPALPALLDGLVRFIPELEIVVALSSREGGSPRLRRRLDSLRLGVDEDPGRSGIALDADRQGRITLHTYDGSDLSAFASECLAGQPIDAAVFLSDPDAADRDARTAMRALRFADSLRVREVRPGPHLQLLVELEAEGRAGQLRRHLAAERCGLAPDALRLTLLSTDQIRNYFMVHSAFVPGLIAIYESLLGARGQELVRLDVDANELRGAVRPERDDPRDAVEPAALERALGHRGAIPFAVELDDGTVITHPRRPIPSRRIRAVFAIAESDDLATRFRPEPKPGADGSPV